MKRRLKSHLESALGVGLGITLGGVIIPRIFFTPPAFTTYPPLLYHMVLYFVTTYMGSLLFFCLLDWLNAQQQKRRQSSFPEK